MKLDLDKFKVKKPQDLKLDINDIKQFEEILDLHGGSTITEHKYDGYGIIIDNRSDLKLYSLAKKEWNLLCFPELLDDLNSLPKGFYMGEILGKKNKPTFTNKDEFNAIDTRSQTIYSNDTIQKAQDNPLEIRLYDLLQLKTKVFAGIPNLEMRKYLEEIQFDNINPVSRREIITPEDLQSETINHINSGREGFVVKDPFSSYSQNEDYVKGSRNKEWIKIKRNLTLDCAVLGLYQTPDRLRQGWACSNLLLGTYNEGLGKYETLTKLTLPQKDLAQCFYDELSDKCQYTFSEKSPYYWQNKGSDLNKSSQVEYSNTLIKGKFPEKIPFMYLDNPKKDSIVVEVMTMDITSPKKTWHSCGETYNKASSLRIPTYLRRREKGPLEATTTEQIMNLRN